MDKKTFRLTGFEKKLCAFLSLGLGGFYIASSINGTYATLFLSELLSLNDSVDSQARLSSQWSVGALLALGSLLCVIVLPLVGRWSDRIKNEKKKRWPFLLVSLFAFALVFPLIPFAFLSRNVPLLIGLLCLIAVSGAVWTMFLTVLMDDFIPPLKRGRFSGWCALFGYGGNWLGYLIGSFFSFSSYLLGKDPWVLFIPFLVADALLLALSFPSLLFAMKTSAKVASSQEKSPQKKGLKISKPILLLWLALIFSTIGFSAFSSFAGPYFQYYLVVDTRNLSLCSLISGLVATACFVPANLLAEKKGGKAISIVAFSLGLVAYLWLFFLKPAGNQSLGPDGSVLSWASFNPQFFGTYVLIGLALGFDNCVYPLYIRFAPGGHQGAYTSYYNAVASMAGCLVPLLMGLLLTFSQVWWCLPLLAVGGFVFAILSFAFVPVPPEEGPEKNLPDAQTQKTGNNGGQ